MVGTKKKIGRCVRKNGLDIRRSSSTPLQRRYPKQDERELKYDLQALDEREEAAVQNEQQNRAGLKTNSDLFRTKTGKLPDTNASNKLEHHFRTTKRVNEKIKIREQKHPAHSDGIGIKSDFETTKKKQEFMVGTKKKIGRCVRKNGLDIRRSSSTPLQRRYPKQDERELKYDLQALEEREEAAEQTIQNVEGEIRRKHASLSGAVISGAVKRKINNRRSVSFSENRRNLQQLHSFSTSLPGKGSIFLEHNDVTNTEPIPEEAKKTKEMHPKVRAEENNDCESKIKQITKKLTKKKLNTSKKSQRLKKLKISNKISKKIEDTLLIKQNLSNAIYKEILALETREIIKQKNHEGALKIVLEGKSLNPDIKSEIRNNKIEAVVKEPSKKKGLVYQEKVEKKIDKLFNNCQKVEKAQDGPKNK